MAGTSAGMTVEDVAHSESNQRVIKVIPFGIHAVNEPDLPRARPMLDRFFTLDCVADVVEAFVIDEQFQSVELGEALDQPFAMLVGTAWQIACHAGI